MRRNGGENKVGNGRSCSRKAVIEFAPTASGRKHPSFPGTFPTTVAGILLQIARQALSLPRPGLPHPASPGAPRGTEKATEARGRWPPPPPPPSQYWPTTSLSPLCEWKERGRERPPGIEQAGSQSGRAKDRPPPHTHTRARTTLTHSPSTRLLCRARCEFLLSRRPP